MKILLIEDDDLLARTMVRMLKRRSHDVAHVEGLQAARIYLKDSIPEVIVTDREVADGIGWEIRGDIDPAKTRVVLMTGNPPDERNLPNFFQKGLEPFQRLYDLIENPVA